MSGILIKNCILVPMVSRAEGSGKGYFLGEIAIRGNKIIHVGGPGTIKEDFSPEQVIDATGKVALPGLINAHTHAGMSLFRGYADDLPLMEWLKKKIWPLEAKLTEEDVYWGTKLSILEMLKAGVTTFADMYFFMDGVARAVAESGIRASLARGMTGGEGSKLAMKEAEMLVEKWHGYENDRITVMLGPHAPYTCPPEFLQEVVQKAKSLGVGIHIHLAETHDEIETITGRYGKPPVELMEELGLFEVPVLAAHCVHLEPHEIGILSRNKVGVAHNPESNMKLASGIAPVPEMLVKGITVALGTDGAASNNNLELFGEMRTGALLHKVNKLDPTVINSYQALEMATKGGAQALGLNDLGVLEPGYKGDLVLMDFGKPHLCPQHDIIAHLVYAAQPADVEMVIIDGKIVVAEGQVLTMDEQEIYQKVEECSARLTS